LAPRPLPALFAVFDDLFLTHLLLFFTRPLLHFLGFGFALTAGAEAAGAGLPSPTKVALA
jgi:hypothetical protein